MIKNYNTRKLSVTSSHRKAMLRNLAVSLFQHEKIQTTLPKAKELARFSAKLITVAKKGDLSAKKTLAGEINNTEVRKKLLEVIAPRYESRAGGYTRIFKLGARAGDGVEKALIKLV